MGDKSSGEGPPPPSPLTGAYLLIVLPQTHIPQHKDNVLHYLTKGLITWDRDECHVDLEKELQTITSQAPEGEEAKNGERLIQFASENLVTEVLIHPQLNTLVQCMRNLLSSFTRHRHIIHAGYTCTGNGAWMLQDGTYSYADFAEMYQEHEVQRVLRAYENTVTVDVHCFQEGDWNNLKGKDPFSKVSRVRLNPNDKMTAGAAINGFLEYMGQYVSSAGIGELLEASDVVGNIRFSHPTLYVFPGGQGDAALFGINGFNMLVDGGFARKACFWDFSRHLDRLDAVLMTRINNGNIQGLSSLVQRKKMDHVYPQIGHFFCNLQERKHPLSPDGDKDRNPLLINLVDQGQELLSGLRQLQLKPQTCYRDPIMEPINLYHKVGHGKLDMYVISPGKDSREVREFTAKWNTSDSKIFCSFTKRGGEFTFPMCNKVSICALLVWQPANPEDNITRILFPGSTPQYKILEGLDKLKNLEFMKHPVCSARTLSPSSSSVGLSQKGLTRPKVPSERIIENEKKSVEPMKPAVKPVEKQPPKPQAKPTPSAPPPKPKPIEKPKEKPKTDVDMKPETVKIDKSKQPEAVQKVDKPKEKPKKLVQKQVERKSVERQVKTEKKTEQKSSPTTPKKTAEVKDTKAETKPRVASRTKPSPSATPAKSAKDANNRKVLEQKTKEVAPKVQKTSAPPPKKDEVKKVEKPVKKPISSPSKAAAKPSSPVKTSKIIGKSKPDPKKGVEDKKNTESAVSTPSTADVELSKIKDDVSDVALEQKKKEPQSTISKDEEDEILIVEQIEINGDGHPNLETVAVHIRKSQESVVAEEAKDDQPIKTEETKPVEIPEPVDLKGKTESQETSVGVKDITTDKLTPPKESRDKSNEIGETKVDESQPDEKFSTTVESGATTAPTLPEDERIPIVDDVKENVEEKHVKEETKEKETARPEQPTRFPEVQIVNGTPFDQRVQQLKDIVKTPDEVADLPVHEEVDAELYDEEAKGKTDLPAPSETADAKESKLDLATEEVKLTKDELEKEIETKDLKEDGVKLVEPQAHITEAQTDSKIEPSDKGEATLLDKEEILDEDKDKGSEKEKGETEKEDVKEKIEDHKGDGKTQPTDLSKQLLDDLDKEDEGIQIDEEDEKISEGVTGPLPPKPQVGEEAKEDADAEGKIEESTEKTDLTLDSKPTTKDSANVPDEAIEAVEAPEPIEAEAEKGAEVDSEKSIETEKRAAGTENEMVDKDNKQNNVEKELEVLPDKDDKIEEDKMEHHAESPEPHKDTVHDIKENGKAENLSSEIERVNKIDEIVRDASLSVVATESVGEIKENIGKQLDSIVAKEPETQPSEVIVEDSHVEELQDVDVKKDMQVVAEDVAEVPVIASAASLTASAPLSTASSRRSSTKDELIEAPTKDLSKASSKESVCEEKDEKPEKEMPEESKLSVLTKEPISAQEEAVCETESSSRPDMSAEEVILSQEDSVEKSIPNGQSSSVLTEIQNEIVASSPEPEIPKDVSSTEKAHSVISAEEPTDAAAPEKSPEDKTHETSTDLIPTESLTKDTSPAGTEMKDSSVLDKLAPHIEPDATLTDPSKEISQPESGPTKESKVEVEATPNEIAPSEEAESQKVIEDVGVSDQIQEPSQDIKSKAETDELEPHAVEQKETGLEGIKSSVIATPVASKSPSPTPVTSDPHEPTPTGSPTKDTSPAGKETKDSIVEKEDESGGPVKEDSKEDKASTEVKDETNLEKKDTSPAAEAHEATIETETGEVVKPCHTEDSPDAKEKNTEKDEIEDKVTNEQETDKSPLAVTKDLATESNIHTEIDNKELDMKESKSIDQGMKETESKELKIELDEKPEITGKDTSAPLPEDPKVEEKDQLKETDVLQDQKSEVQHQTAPSPTSVKSDDVGEKLTSAELGDEKPAGKEKSSDLSEIVPKEELSEAKEIDSTHEIQAKEALSVDAKGKDGNDLPKVSSKEDLNEEIKEEDSSELRKIPSKEELDVETKEKDSSDLPRISSKEDLLIDAKEKGSSDSSKVTSMEKHADAKEKVEESVQMGSQQNDSSLPKVPSKEEFRADAKETDASDLAKGFIIEEPKADAKEKEESTEVPSKKYVETDAKEKESSDLSKVPSKEDLNADSLQKESIDSPQISSKEDIQNDAKENVLGDSEKVLLEEDLPVGAAKQDSSDLPKVPSNEDLHANTALQDSSDLPKVSSNEDSHANTALQDSSDLSKVTSTEGDSEKVLLEEDLPVGAAKQDSSDLPKVISGEGVKTDTKEKEGDSHEVKSKEDLRVEAPQQDLSDLPKVISKEELQSDAKEKDSSDSDKFPPKGDIHEDAAQQDSSSQKVPSKEDLQIDDKEKESDSHKALSKEDLQTDAHQQDSSDLSKVTSKEDLQSDTKENDLGDSHKVTPQGEDDEGTEKISSDSSKVPSKEELHELSEEKGSSESPQVPSKVELDEDTKEKSSSNLPKVPHEEGLDVGAKVEDSADLSTFASKEMGTESTHKQEPHPESTTLGGTTEPKEQSLIEKKENEKDVTGKSVTESTDGTESNTITAKLQSTEEVVEPIIEKTVIKKEAFSIKEEMLEVEGTSLNQKEAESVGGSSSPVPEATKSNLSLVESINPSGESLSKASSKESVSDINDIEDLTKGTSPHVSTSRKSSTHDETTVSEDKALTHLDVQADQSPRTLSKASSKESICDVKDVEDLTKDTISPQVSTSRKSSVHDKTECEDKAPHLDIQGDQSPRNLSKASSKESICDVKDVEGSTMGTISPPASASRKSSVREEMTEEISDKIQIKLDSQAEVSSKGLSKASSKESIADVKDMEADFAPGSPLDRSRKSSTREDSKVFETLSEGKDISKASSKESITDAKDLEVEISTLGTASPASGSSRRSSTDKMAKGDVTLGTCTLDVKGSLPSDVSGTTEIEVDKHESDHVVSLSATSSRRSSSREEVVEKIVVTADVTAGLDSRSSFDESSRVTTKEGHSGASSRKSSGDQTEQLDKEVQDKLEKTEEKLCFATSMEDSKPSPESVQLIPDSKPVAQATVTEVFFQEKVDSVQTSQEPVKTEANGKTGIISEMSSTEVKLTEFIEEESARKLEQTKVTDILDSAERIVTSSLNGKTLSGSVGKYDQEFSSRTEKIDLDTSESTSTDTTVHVLSRIGANGESSIQEKSETETTKEVIDDKSIQNGKSAVEKVVAGAKELVVKLDENVKEITHSFLNMEAHWSGQVEEGLKTPEDEAKEIVQEVLQKGKELVEETIASGLKSRKDVITVEDPEVGRSTPLSDISGGSRSVTHVGSESSRRYDSDDDLPGSPLSVSSHVPSPEPVMTGSFYGALPDPVDKPDPNAMFTSIYVAKYDEDDVPPPAASAKPDEKKDPIEKWDKPLGLPPPPPPLKNWGRPLGLPSPAPPPRDEAEVDVDTSGSAKTTPKKVAKMNAENNKYASNTHAGKDANNKFIKRSESPVKRSKESRRSGPSPIYMDLSYVPHHGNSHYANVEFFKRVRARYYVFSGTEPNRDVFNALLEAKQTWEDKDLEVTIIPTYDTDTLGFWISENEETLSKYKIDLSPSASRCTINLQDHDTSCSAYRLEF